MSLPGYPLFLSRTSILTGKWWISGINMYVLVYPPPLTKVFPSHPYVCCCVVMAQSALDIWASPLQVYGPAHKAKMGYGLTNNK